MASDRVRFYDRETLQPVEMVPKKSGEGFRKATIKDARANLYLGGVTSIVDELANFGVMKYKLRELAKACMVIPFTGDLEDLTEMQTEQMLKDYEAKVYPKAAEHAAKAAEEGTAIHKACNLYLAESLIPDNPIHLSICENLHSFLKRVDAKDIELEHSIASLELGFAGTPDIWFSADRALLEQALGLESTCEPGERAWVIVDIKSTDLGKYKKPYESWRLQLGGYRGLTKCNDGTFLVQMVVDRKHGDVKWETHENPDAAWTAFQHLFEVWTWLHQYDPREAA